jgi:peptidoglycan/xylan/chitin deacetylase (PgdA/CDA1 family)
MRNLQIFIFLGLLGVTASAQRTVAITVDDLPYARGNLIFKDRATEEPVATEVNRKLLAAFRARHIEATGFVIQKSVESLGVTGARILERWTKQGLELGNHTYSHPDINDLSVEEIQDEIVRGEPVIGPLMRNMGEPLKFFRFPYNHTGDTKAKHDAVMQFLSQRGYTVATCTIDNSDYIFNEAYVHMLDRRDSQHAKRLRSEYLAYTKLEIGYYATLNMQVLGYQPPQVMLLHANRLNASVIVPLLALFTDSGYRFVSLATAQSAAAYRPATEEYITKFGPMWGYRWAAERSVKVNGNLEPEPPRWILEYNKSTRQRTGPQ